MVNVWNWTNRDARPRGIEIGCFFGLFTTRIYRFSSPFLKIAFFLFYTSKNCHFSGSIFGHLFITFWNGRINLSKYTFQSDLRGQNGLYAPFFLRTTIYVKIPFHRIVRLKSYVPLSHTIHLMTSSAEGTCPEGTYIGGVPPPSGTDAHTKNKKRIKKYIYTYNVLP